MKTLDQFKTISEEKSDYSKFDMLVRAGLANKAQLQRIHRILDKMQEEKPVFNNADRMILQNLFNRMVDLISNNKQIFMQTRRAVHEDLEEGVIATSDYKVSTSGQKYKAHRIKVGQDAPQIGDDSDNTNEEIEIIEAEKINAEPPFTLVLKRKAIRQYPGDTNVALYYNDKLKKYFTIPFTDSGKKIDSVIQAEETQIEESVMDQLHKIVKDKTANRVKFATGETRRIDHYTASAITQVHNALNDDNKKKFADMVHKSPAHFSKASDFAFKHVK